MAKIIRFPERKKSNNISSEIDELMPAFEKAKARLEKRLGVTLWEYLGMEGDKEETSRKIARAMQKETMMVRTKYMNEPDEDLSKLDIFSESNHKE